MKSAVFNATALLTPLTGIGRYALEISKRISEKDLNAEIFYYYGYYSKKLEEGGAGQDEMRESVFGRFMKSGSIAARAARKLMRSVPKKEKVFDLYWEPNIVLDPAVKSKKTLLTLHDLSVIKFPQWHPKERVEHYDRCFKQSMERVDRVITDSAFIREEVLSHFGLDPSLVVSIPLGYDTAIFHTNPDEGEKERVKKTYTGGREYILFAGSVEPRKNLLNLLKAYNELADEFKKEFVLLLAGFSGWENREIMQLIDLNKESIRYAGYVDYRELGCLYRGASLFAYPSFYEGFGLPPLEAMACGCPVIVSPMASLPEVCGGAAEYVDPENICEIKDTVSRVLSDSGLRSTMSVKGLRQAQSFSWDTAADRHKEIMKKML